MKKNVLFLGAFREPGGEEEVITYLYKNLDREKYNAYLCGPSSATFFEKHQINQEEFLSLEMDSKYDWKSLKRLMTYIKKYDIDIIHSHGNRGGLYGRLAAFLASKKVISLWTLHLLIEENNFTISKFRKKIYIMIEKVLNRLMTDWVIAVSDDLNKKYRTIYNTNNVITIHNGIDIQKYTVQKKYDTSNECITFGFISRLSQQKGLPYLIQAFSLLHSQYKNEKNLELIIVGTGDEEENTKRMVKEYGINESVKFLGFRKDIPEVLKSIDLLVLPSLFEGFPMIILESLCSGTPVVASKVNGIPEVIENGLNGILTEPRNVDDLKKAMEFYVKNSLEIRKHGEYGREVVSSKFTKEIMLQKHEELFERLLN